MDFTGTHIMSGQRIQILLIVDTTNRQIPAIHPKALFTDTDVTEVLDQLIVAGKLPTIINTDHAQVFVSNALTVWTERNQITLVHPRHGYPRGSSYIQSLTRRLHDECLDYHACASIEEIQAVLEVWRVNYNALSRT